MENFPATAEFQSGLFSGHC